jgi:DNA repair protein RecO (recombination protein O)
MRKGVESEAIVIRSKMYGEDDLLVEFLTLRDGRIWGKARHGRKSRKRFGTVLEPLNILQLRYRDSGNFVFLEEAALERPLSRLRTGLESLSIGFYFLDLIRELVPQRSPDARAFSLLKESLVHLNDNKSPGEIVSEFEHRLLDLCGYSPHLEACIGCQKKWEPAAKFFFVFREGGIFCADCLPSQVSFELFSREALSEILPKFIEYQLGRPLRSLEFKNRSRVA